MHTCLVTGGYGGLGSNICVELAERGIRTVAHGISSDPPTNIETASAHVREKIVRRTCDLRDSESLRQIITEEGVDGVIHSGALLPTQSKDIRPSFDVNANGTLSLLESAVEEGAPRFVYVGSGSVYSNRPPDEKPYSEDEIPQPTFDRAYSITKYVGEMLTEHFDLIAELDTTVVRVSRLWGEPTIRTGDRAYPMDRVISDLLEGREIVRENGGDHPNDYTHNRDAARGIVLAYLSDREDRDQSVYNVSGGRHVTVDEIIDVCSEEFDGKVEFGPGYWEELPQSLRPPFDISAAQRDLDYEPEAFEKRLRQHISFRKTQYRDV